MSILSIMSITTMNIVFSFVYSIMILPFYGLSGRSPFLHYIHSIVYIHVSVHVFFYIWSIFSARVALVSSMSSLLVSSSIGGSINSSAQKAQSLLSLSIFALYEVYIHFEVYIYMESPYISYSLYKWGLYISVGINPDVLSLRRVSGPLY